MAEMTAKIRVEGLGEFRSAMSQASASVRQSTAEEKKAEAQYRETGDAAAYQQQKTEALTKKLEAQGKQVEAARKACAALEKAGVAPDDKRLVEWKTKLANAEAEMSKTRTELGRVKTSMTEVGDTAKKTGGEIEGIAGKLDRETLVKGLDAVADKMEAVIQKAWQMGKAIWDASTDAATWADATRDAATAAGMTTTEYQQMAYAAQFFGLSIDDLTNKQGKLVKAMDAGGQIMVGDWAVDTIDRVTGKRRSFSNVMMDIVDGLGQIEDPIARDQAAMDLFGKSYKDLNGLIEGGQEAWQDRIDEAPVVREETVNSLADTADALKEMDARLETLKMETLAALAPSITTIAEAVGTLAQNLTDFLQTEEGQKLLTDLGKAINDIVTAITGDDFSGLVQTAATALGNLTEGLQWIADHKDAVIAAVTGLGIAFGGVKVGSFALKTTEVISSITRLLGIGAAGTGGAALAGGGGGASLLGGAGAAAGTGIMAKLGGALSSGLSGLSTVALPAAVIAGGVVVPWLVNKNDREARQAELDARVAQAEAEAAAIGEAANATLDIVHVTAEAMGNTGEIGADFLEVQGDFANEAAALEQLAGMDTSMLTGRQRLLLSHGSALDSAGRHSLLDEIMLTAAGSMGQSGGYSGNVMTDVSDTLDAILDMKEALDTNMMQVATSGSIFSLIDDIVENEGVMSKLSDETKELLGNWYSGGNTSPTAFTDAAELLEVIESDLNNAWDEYVSGGEQVGNGMAEGIRKAAPRAIAEATAMANGIHLAVRTALEIASPSRKMIGLGSYIGAGLAEGINRSISQVESAATRMSRAAERPVAAAAGSTYNNPVTNNHYFHVGEYVQNSESDLNALARKVLGVQRDMRQGYGRRK